MNLYENQIFVPQGNMNIPRRNMPQVDKAHFADMLVWLKSQGVSVRRVKTKAIKLKPVQKEINLQAVEQLVKSKDPKLSKPFLITRDGFILDGHHRWLALLNIDRGASIDAFELSMPAKDALAILREYPRSLYKDARNAEYNQPDHGLKLEGDEMPMTEKERFMAELQESLRGIDPSIMSGDEYAAIVTETIEDLVHPGKLANEKKYSSFREFVNEAKSKRFDDPNERIQIRGFGVVTVGIVEKMLEDRLKEVDKFRQKKDWRSVRALIQNTAIMPLLDALKEIQDANE